MVDGRGERYNKGKTRHDLKPAFAEEQYAKILTLGSEKYAERNWERGMKWSQVLASLERHLYAIKRGEDYDPESGELHAAHVMCNAAFLTEYYKIYPQGDDRPKHLRNLRIGLDIDGVLADFNDTVKERYDIHNSPEHWYYSYTFKSGMWEELAKDPDFWLSIPPYFDGSKLPFDPIVYVTHRPIDTEVSKQWLEKNHFPCVPVETVNGNKSEVLKKYNIDIFVEDKYENFVQLNKEGIFTYLLDRPWNQKFDVGHMRIYNLEDIIKY